MTNNLKLDFATAKRDLIATLLLCSYQQQGAKHSNERIEHQIELAFRTADKVVAYSEASDYLDREGDVSDVPDADEVLGENG